MSMLPMDPFIIFVFICFSLNTFTSYPVQMLAVFQVLEGTPSADDKKTWDKTLMRNVFRIMLIATVTYISMSIPNFTDLLNISGSLGATLTSFLIPQMLYMTQFKGQLSYTKLMGCWVLIAFGIFASYSSISYTMRQA